MIISCKYDRQLVKFENAEGYAWSTGFNFCISCFLYEWRWISWYKIGCRLLLETFNYWERLGIDMPGSVATLSSAAFKFLDCSHNPTAPRSFMMTRLSTNFPNRFCETFSNFVLNSNNFKTLLSFYFHKTPNS